MTMEEFISFLTENGEEEQNLQSLRRGIPLGKDADGNVAFSQSRERPYTVRLTCVTGEKKTEFITRLLLTLSCLYRADEATVLILSPNAAYTPFLTLNGADINFPITRNKGDLGAVKNFLKEWMTAQDTTRGCPRLILVLDGLETLPDFEGKTDLAEYREFFELLARRTDVDVVAGVELSGSMFVGFPGAFVGISNTLVTTNEEGKADVTHVKDDCSLSLPTPVIYPCEPSLLDAIASLNGLQNGAKAE